METQRMRELHGLAVPTEPPGDGVQLSLLEGDPGSTGAERRRQIIEDPAEREARRAAREAFLNYQEYTPVDDVSWLERRMFESEEDGGVSEFDDDDNEVPYDRAGAAFASGFGWLWSVELLRVDGWREVNDGEFWERP